LKEEAKTQDCRETEKELTPVAVATKFGNSNQAIARGYPFSLVEMPIDRGFLRDLRDPPKSYSELRAMLKPLVTILYIAAPT